MKKKLMQKERAKKIIAGMIMLTIVSGLFAVSFSEIAHAQTTSGVTRTNLNVEDVGDFVVGPGKQEIFLNPGETATRYINITSRTKTPTKFTLTTEDFVGSSDPANAVVLLGDSKGPYSLKDLLKPAITEFTLEFGEKIVIPVTVSSDLNAEPGGYYGAVLVSGRPVNENGVVTIGGAVVNSRIGSLFLVRVNGPTTESGKLEDFKVGGPKKLFHDKTPAAFEVLFKNDGNVHLIPYGKITVKNLFKRTVAEVPVDAYFALPDSLRYREVVWNEEGFGLGRYTAELSLYRGYGNQYDTKKIAFWIIPWKIVIALFVVVLLISYIIYFILSRFEFKKKQ